MYDVRITDLAEQDIDANFRWWSDHRSAEQAARWYEAIYPAIHTLSTMPQRCPRTNEEDPSGNELRELLFTIGRRPTHRIVFAIEEDAVIIFRVRHVAQRPLSADDLRELD